METVKVTSIDGITTLRAEGSSAGEVSAVQSRAADLLQQIAIEIEPEHDPDLANLLDTAWRDIARSRA